MQSEKFQCRTVYVQITSQGIRKKQKLYRYRNRFSKIIECVVNLNAWLPINITFNFYIMVGFFSRKCNYLFPRTEAIYSSRENFHDAVGDNPRLHADTAVQCRVQHDHHYCRKTPPA